MSASPVARAAVAHPQTTAQSIPKRITYNSSSELPNDYSTTPGGTLFSTTPGGTRIIYERKVLMQLKNSPLSQTPPKNLPKIPGVTVKSNSTNCTETIAEEPESTKENEDDQFDLEL